MKEGLALMCGNALALPPPRRTWPFSRRCVSPGFFRLCTTKENSFAFLRVERMLS